MAMPNIILTTLNARYIHCSLGLRYLYANLGDLQSQCVIQEFIIDKRPIDIVEQLLQTKPKIIGFGVYIWNIQQCTETISILKQLSPETIVVIGGPEVSYENKDLDISRYADFVISGQADLEFANLCNAILNQNHPTEKWINCLPPKLDELKLPYSYYKDEDVANRVIYVEASRGCPFKCEFCLSALDKTAIAFDQDLFLDEMQKLYERGVRQFKFVDRTFNLKIDASIRILEFFLARMENNLFVHFELIPDHLPEKLKVVIKRFPAGALQFEIGVQTFNPEIQALISRKQNNEKSRNNISWLSQETETHLHTDLILGLPGEDLQSIAQGFNELYALKPHEIQVGVLKRLKGTPILRHSDVYEMRYNPNPPYNILSTSTLDFNTMQRLSRFARYWDMIGNSGRFSSSIDFILGLNPFQTFLTISDWLFDRTGQTHRIALARLFDLLYTCLTQELARNQQETANKLWEDFQKSGLKGVPGFMKTDSMLQTKNNLSYTPRRQNRHLQ